MAEKAGNRHLYYTWPYATRPKVNGKFGARRNSASGGTHWHVGTDFDDANDVDHCSILACTDGVVEFAGQHKSILRGKGSGLGLCVVINHDDDPYSSIYGHLNQITVRAGQHVRMGERIGVQGDTGDCTGVHCHFQVDTYKGHVSNGELHVARYNGSTPLAQAKVIDPIYLLTNGKEHTPGIETNRDSSSYDISVGTTGAVYDSVFNLSVGGSQLLEPSDDERKYGLSMFDTTQSLIRDATAMGVTGVSNQNAYDALKRYAKYIYYYLNSQVSVANIQTVSMPWIRPGFNVWLDPLHTDRIYYVNAVSHQGSAGGGVYTTLSLSFCRERKRFQNAGYTFGSLTPGANDNVFINTISAGPERFSKAILGSAADFDALKARVDAFYSAETLSVEKALYHPYYQYLYNTINNEVGTVDGTHVSPIIGQKLKDVIVKNIDAGATVEPTVTFSNAASAQSQKKTISAQNTNSGKIEVGSTVKLNGKVHYNQQGEKPGKTVYKDKIGKITKVGTLSNPYPYHFGAIGWVSPASITLVSNASDTIASNSTTTSATFSPAATKEFNSVEEIQAWLDKHYVNPPQVIKDRIQKHKTILEQAEQYKSTHYVHYV